MRYPDSLVLGPLIPCFDVNRWSLVSKTEVHRRARDVRVVCAVHLELVVGADLQVLAGAETCSLKLAGMCREGIPLMLEQLPLPAVSTVLTLEIPRLEYWRG